MEEQMLKVFSRLKQSGDGIEFLEYLKRVEKNNFNAFMQCESKLNDIIKGQAIAITGLIQLFETCDDKLASLEPQNKEAEVNAFN